MYRILIVEDNRQNAETLEGYVARYAKEHGVGLSCSRIASAIEFAAEEHPADLIFMDIQLPGVNGLEASELLRVYDESTPIIFVTNLAQYAVSAYKVDALDFIVKPVRYHDFCMSMGRALKRMKRNAGRTITVQAKDGLHVVDITDIAYVDVLDHSLSVHLGNGTSLTSRSTLGTLEEELGSTQFTRASKSCIVNMGHIKRICKDTLELTDGTAVYLSRSRRKPALAAIAEYLGGSV